MAEIHESNSINAHILELRRENVKIVSDIKEQAGVLSHLEGRNKATTRALREEAKWIETATNANIQPSEIDFKKILENSSERNKLVMQEMDQQKKVILHLKKYYESAVNQSERHTEKMLDQVENQAKYIFKLESQNKKLESQNNTLESQVNGQKRAIFTLTIEKGTAEYERQEQIRVAESLENRLTKMKEVLNNQAHTMLAELDYQQELIDELDPVHEEYFRPSHNTMMDMTENIEHWTSEDNDNADMTFEFESDSHISHEIISDLEKKVDLQEMKLDHQQGKIIAQTKIIFDLEYQKRRLTSDLEAQTERMTCLLELQNIKKEKEKREEREGKAVDRSNRSKYKKWHIEHLCNAACKEEKESMRQEISNLNYRLRPLESNLLNSRQSKLCTYLKNRGSITTEEANEMLRVINQSEASINPAEADARMVQDRMPQHAHDFLRIYGVSHEKIIESSK